MPRSQCRLHTKLHMLQKSLHSAIGDMLKTKSLILQTTSALTRINRKILDKNMYEYVVCTGNGVSGFRSVPMGFSY